jgi:hypothetical protein
MGYLLGERSTMPPMSLNVPGLCENTLPIFTYGKKSRKDKGFSSAEKGRYFFDPILVAVGSKLVQEGEIKQTRTGRCRFLMYPQGNWRFCLRIRLSRARR